jgi:predicted enzyme related to lactoylglutathione lyase
MIWVKEACEMHIELTLDVNDAPTMLAFWGGLLRYSVEDEARFDEPDRIYWSLVDPTGRGPRLVIQRVPEPVSAKTRLHVDIHTRDLDTEVLRAVSLGATRVDTEAIVEVGTRWIRLTDPEGNLFCVVEDS